MFFRKFRDQSADLKIPVRDKEGDACYDIFAPYDIYISPGHTARIPSGIACVVPEGRVGILRDRSSSAWKADKSGLTLRKAVIVCGGMIDSNYRGEILVVLHNCGPVEAKWKKDEAFVQMLVVDYFYDEPVWATDEQWETLKETNRGESGFGSSDKPTPSESDTSRYGDIRLPEQYIKQHPEVKESQEKLKEARISNLLDISGFGKFNEPEKPLTDKPLTDKPLTDKPLTEAEQRLRIERTGEILL